MTSSLRNVASLRTVSRSAVISAVQQSQPHRCLSNLSRPLAAAASRLPSSQPTPSTRTPTTTPLSSTTSSIRHHSTLPVQQYYVPRMYPFPLILTTEILAEEDVELYRANPHDLPAYKSTLTVNIHDLPLNAAEKRVFRLLVGPRIYSTTFHPHPVPAFLTNRHSPHIPRQRRQRTKDSAVKVTFVSRHLPSAQANENRVFQLLDETIRQCKVLVGDMAVDGQWVEEGEEEMTLRVMKGQLREEARREREAGGGGVGVVGGGEEVKMVGGESAGREVERERVLSGSGEQTVPQGADKQQR